MNVSLQLVLVFNAVQKVVTQRCQECLHDLRVCMLECRTLLGAFGQAWLQLTTRQRSAGMTQGLKDRFRLTHCGVVGLASILQAYHSQRHLGLHTSLLQLLRNLTEKVLQGSHCLVQDGLCLFVRGICNQAIQLAIGHHGCLVYRMHLAHQHCQSCIQAHLGHEYWHGTFTLALLRSVHEFVPRDLLLLGQRRMLHEVTHI
mmetsp:Transcript_69659/g.166252  ORF Transcript_69659/g.166252 Transcript_69659/m.166252 type:complete len:201 (+) Transcript_69659:295-897(+)